MALQSALAHTRLPNLRVRHLFLFEIMADPSLEAAHSILGQPNKVALHFLREREDHIVTSLPECLMFQVLQAPVVEGEAGRIADEKIPIRCASCLAEASWH